MSANAAAATAFSVKLDKWLAKSKEAARLKFIDICLDAAERIVERTPVDTGFCRAMWSVSINAVPAMKPIDRPESWESKSGVGNQGAGGAAAAAQAMGRIEPELLLARISDRIWIYNPVVYAPALEAGHSGQAPQGMVKITLVELRAIYG